MRVLAQTIREKLFLYKMIDSNPAQSLNSCPPIRWLIMLCILGSPLKSQTENVVPPLATDPSSGMIIADNWELVRNTCIICHSPQTFLRQRGTEITWREIIAWMQESGGLAPLPQENKEKIIAYLTRYYGPGETYRRSPIPATLMPENPYVSETRKTWIQSQK